MTALARMMSASPSTAPEQPDRARRENAYGWQNLRLQHPHQPPKKGFCHVRVQLKKSKVIVLTDGCMGLEGE